MHKAEHVLYMCFSGNLNLWMGLSYISLRMVLLNIHAAHPEMFETQVTHMMSVLFFSPQTQQLYPLEIFHLLGCPMTVAVLRGAVKETRTSLYSFYHGLL